MNPQALLLFVGVAGFLALAGALLSVLNNRHKRRARMLQHAQQSARRQQEGSQRGIGAGRTEAIRGHAERCARRDWEAGGDTSQPLNPFRAGSPQAVLWYASYQIALHELVEGDRSGGQRGCPPYENVSTTP